jgi:hypothetical protein
MIWEYESREISLRNIQDSRIRHHLTTSMNEVGRQGWEVCGMQFNHIDSIVRQPICILYLKRLSIPSILGGTGVYRGSSEVEIKRQ